ncbi:MAG: radical SAM protein [Ruminococcus sp.]|nr:radical SAM protein [Ruminococcus sp.]
MANVAIFVPHNGCPNKCSFCDQRHITGCVSQPNAEDVKNTLNIALSSLKEKSKDAEIAFFGGSFTAIDRKYMLELLESTKEYVNNFKGIRISTRPDAINSEILEILKNYKVSSIELGAQSMVDSVLLANERGHSAEDVRKASMLIKSCGFSLGLQMMTGLYKSSDKLDVFTAAEFIKLKPDTVRIYPTVVLTNTTLATLYKRGTYNPQNVEKAAELCSKLILMFENADIDIIRVGLHDSESLKSNIISGAFHPAFRELCEAQIYLNKILLVLKEQKISNGDVLISVPKNELSKAIGQKGHNKQRLISLGYKPKFTEDDTLANRQVLIKKG